MSYVNNDTSAQKEIGILEIRRHIPILYSFIKICKTKKTNVTVFTTKELFLRLKTYLDDKGKYKFVIKKDYESYKSFLNRVEKICNDKIDVLIINTIHETFLKLLCYLGFNPKIKTILVLHHVNAWMNPRFVCNIYHPLRTFDTYISTILIKKIFPKFDALNVIYSPLKNYIKDNLNYDKKIFTLPTSIFEEKKLENVKKEENKIYIAIPGLIQKHRKEYQPVILVLDNIFKKFKKEISVSIPGQPIDKYGKEIYNTFLKMRKQGYDIELFDSFVPDNVFDKILNKCDVILAPIRIKTRADNEIEEIYGKTVGSGVIFNAIKFAKPIIVPSEFNMLKELNTSTLRYKDSEELKIIIEDLILNPDNLKKLKKEALKNSEKYSLEKMRKYFKDNVLDWLK